MSRDTKYRFTAISQHVENVIDSVRSQMHPSVELNSPCWCSAQVEALLYPFALEKTIGFPSCQENILFSWTVAFAPEFGYTVFIDNTGKQWCPEPEKLYQSNELLTSLPDSCFQESNIYAYFLRNVKGFKSRKKCWSLLWVSSHSH